MTWDILLQSLGILAGSIAGMVMLSFQVSTSLTLLRNRSVNRPVLLWLAFIWLVPFIGVVAARALVNRK